jgi:hypothetical protein
MTDAFQEQLDNLQLKRKEVDALYIKLENSYKIQKLIPDAYEHGACVQTWVDVGRETVNFKVTRGDGSVREIPLEELPEEFVNHLIKEKGIIGHLHSDNKNCGRTLLTEKLSKVKSRQWAKKVRKKSYLLEDRISQLRAAISDNNNKIEKEGE